MNSPRLTEATACKRLLGLMRFGRETCRFALCAATVCLMSAAPVVAQFPQPFPVTSEQSDIRIEETRWGFDGTVEKLRFVPLSILIHNTANESFESKMDLTRNLALGRRVGGVYRRDVFIEPGGQRWVQFFPYVSGDWEEWELQWGDDQPQREPIPRPRLGETKPVVLVEPDSVMRPIASLPTFDESLFPPSVSGTGGLNAVVLDHTPRWQTARREAFLDWLRAGGTVFLAPTVGGRSIDFPSALADLNQPSNRFSAGAGSVVRIPELATLKAENLRDLGLRTEPPQEDRKSQYEYYHEGWLNDRGWDRDAVVFENLRKMTNFSRHWWLIYLIVLAYIGAVYPGSYLIAREANHWRVYYLSFLGIAAAFAVTLAVLGRSTGMDGNRVRTLVVARHLQDREYAARGWLNLASISSGSYTIEHAGRGRLYSTIAELERVDAVATFGPQAQLVLDMPPVSRNDVVYRTAVDLPFEAPQLAGLQRQEGRLDSLQVQLPAALVTEDTMGWAAMGASVFRLKLIGDRLAVGTARGQSMRGFLTGQFAVTFGQFGQQVEEEITDDDERWQELARTAIGNSLGLNETAELDKIRVPPGQLRVFIYAPLPETLKVLSPDLRDQEGRVLLVYNYSI